MIHTYDEYIIYFVLFISNSEWYQTGFHVLLQNISETKGPYHTFISHTPLAVDHKQNKYPALRIHIIIISQRDIFVTGSRIVPGSQRTFIRSEVLCRCLTIKFYPGNLFAVTFYYNVAAGIRGTFQSGLLLFA